MRTRMHASLKIGGLTAGLYWSPAPAICQMSSTVSSASSPQHLWDLAFSVAGPRVWNSLPDHLRDPAVDPEHLGDT